MSSITASPSSTSATLTSASSSSTSATSSGGSGGFSGQSTPLYLFTFLATLFVLLFVSCAIVLRSFFLRRRFRRRIEEAIAAGVLLPPPPGLGSRRRDFGEKPKLWDADAHPAASAEWDDLKPIAARVPPKPNMQQDPPPQRKRHHPFSLIVHSFVPPSVIRRPRDPIRTPVDVSESEPPSDPLADTAEVQVAVFVAMPNPDRPRYFKHLPRLGEVSSLKGKERSSAASWDDENEVPDVVVGVTEVPLRTDAASPTPSSHS